MTVTIYHKGYDPVNRMDVWTRNTYEATVYSDNKINVDNGGVSSANVHKIRIFTAGEVAVDDDDRVTLGLCEDGTPPEESKKVISWSDNRNRKLTRKSWHWRVACV